VANQVALQIAEIRERTGGSFFVNEQPVYDLDRLDALMRYFHEEHGCRYFVIDYIQLVGARDFDTLLKQVTNASSRVREFAKRRNVITVGLSQFNRETSKDYTRSPIPQSLLGGSPLENDSDQVLLLDHKHKRHKETDHGAQTYAILGKNRHGSPGEFPIEWDFRTLRVRER
jgi:replicative DNA helicase